MKLWLFDLAHSNIPNQEDIVKGFIKHYVLFGRTIGNVQDDIVFHTLYGETGLNIAMTNLKDSLMNFCEK